MNRAPQGQFFYVVTLASQTPGRKYLMTITRPQVKGGAPVVRVAALKSRAQRFDSRQLAGAYVDFLNRLLGGLEFGLCMESAA